VGARKSGGMVSRTVQVIAGVPPLNLLAEERGAAYRRERMVPRMLKDH
jgi:hypothetical protein